MSLSDKEYFLKEWQQANIKYPDLFGVQAKRFVRTFCYKDKIIADEIKIQPIDYEILVVLSKEPTRKFFAKEILERITLSKEVKNITIFLTRLTEYGYIKAQNTHPHLYQITTKGLKVLNKIIGDYN